MKSIFKGFLLVFVSFCLCCCADSGSKKKSTTTDLITAASSPKACVDKHQDSLLICDEFRSRFESKKILCVISYSNECPIAKSYIATIKSLVQRFGDTVQFCLLDPGVGSRPISGLEELLFHDNRGIICGRFGIKVYPQVVVYDCLTRSNIYSGKIDDRVVSLGVISKRATKNYLSDVLDNVILGKSNFVASNEAIGCFVGPFDDEK
ncbi:MAG: hypothetical protein RL233_1500 [Bacteroidota bacterium]|jgi:hypothetical protein